MVSSVLNTLALAGSAAALTLSPAASQVGCLYNVANVGGFNTMFSADFSSGATLGSDFSTSVYTVASGTSPYARRFDMTNLGFSAANSALTLTVPGGQTTGPISSSQLVTSYSDILYGSVRTVAMISNTPGTTHGFTFYSNDTQEIDFAFLTSNTTMVHLTNEAVNGGNPSTAQYSAPSDLTTKFHEYRVDWTPSGSTFFIDGAQIASLNTNVPSSAGFWVWNNWSNGNAWAAGPPTADSVLQIQSITGYVNRTSVAESIASGATTCAVASSSIASTSTKAVSASSLSLATLSIATVSASSIKASTVGLVLPTLVVPSVASVVATSSTSTSTSVVPTTTSSSSSSSIVKTTSTSTTSAKATSTGLASGATCGTLFGGATSACATGLTCTLSGMSYVCTASATTNSFFH